MTAPPAPHSLAGPGIILPAAFRAFRTLREPAYRAYTDAHASPAESAFLLARGLGDLAANWSVIMLRSDAAAYAWDLFATTVRHHSERIRIPVTCPLQYEIVVLHHLAGCTIERTSETTGRPREKVFHLLSSWAP
ncbi:hypothetical protein [Streptomyces anulatus]|uniref:hypothetical protein n=1 Tax=Streptomyces anulatus TaxID=1892 RepID=UPI002F9183A7|nr:hypothetical protein OG238_41600 [Streptomyces anulatus]